MNKEFWPEDHNWCGCPECDCTCSICSQPERLNPEDHILDVKEMVSDSPNHDHK